MVPLGSSDPQYPVNPRRAAVPGRSKVAKANARLRSAWWGTTQPCDARFRRLGAPAYSAREPPTSPGPECQVRIARSL